MTTDTHEPATMPTLPTLPAKVSHQLEQVWRTLFELDHLTWKRMPLVRNEPWSEPDPWSESLIALLRAQEAVAGISHTYLHPPALPTEISRMSKLTAELAGRVQAMSSDSAEWATARPQVEAALVKVRAAMAGPMVEHARAAQRMRTGSARPRTQPTQPEQELQS